MRGWEAGLPTYSSQTSCFTFSHSIPCLWFSLYFLICYSPLLHTSLHLLPSSSTFKLLVPTHLLSSILYASFFPFCPSHNSFPVTLGHYLRLLVIMYDDTMHSPVAVWVGTGSAYGTHLLSSAHLYLWHLSSLVARIITTLLRTISSFGVLGSWGFLQSRIPTPAWYRLVALA